MTGTPLRPPRRRKRTEHWHPWPPGVMIASADVACAADSDALTVIYRIGLNTWGEAWWRQIAIVTPGGVKRKIRGAHWKLEDELSTDQRERLTGGKISPEGMLSEVIAGRWHLGRPAQQAPGWDNGENPATWAPAPAPVPVLAPPPDQRKVTLLVPSQSNGHRK